MKPISEEAKRPPTAEEAEEATEILLLISKSSNPSTRVGLLAYFLREAEETGRRKERQSLGPK